MRNDRPPAARKGRLRPGELAEAAVLGDLSLVLEVVGWFSPIGISGLFQALAVIPFAVLAARHRGRAAIVAAIAACTVASLVGGIAIVIPTGIAAGLGLSAGVGYRRRWPLLVSLGFTMLVVGLPVALFTDALDAAAPSYRKLALDQIKIVWRAFTRVLDAIGAGQLATTGTKAVDWVIAHWYVSLPIGEFTLVFLVALAALRLRPFLIEVARRVPLPVSDEAAERAADAVGSKAVAGLAAGVAPADPRPVPVRLENVSYRYPGTDTDALVDVSFSLEPGRLLAVVGPNGSGKSTVVRILAGRIEPLSGGLVREGLAGFGVRGGTAMVFQRPESQVLGVRVRDDLCWGLPPLAPDAMAGLLARVGLGGFEDRETATMSGGELQRLAIAAALARSPKLLVSDESTAMIDQPGRTEVVALLRQLTSSGLAVVHVTHRPEEAAVADEVLLMRAGRVVEDSPGPESPGVVAAVRAEPPAEVATSRAGPEPMWRLDLSPKPTISSLKFPRPRPVAADPELAPVPIAGAADGADGYAPVPAARPPHPADRVDKPLVWLKEVGYVYAQGTPWSRRALSGVDLKLWRGEGVVITGPNGSGKSTLAWLLAGLTDPTEGDALLDSQPIAEQTERVGISFQHARLQLLRPTVIADVSLGADEDRARRALNSVGLDPDEMGPRRIDDLSGGEQRRVALAGILVRKPDLIVLDEPYAGLDDDARKSLAWALALARRTSGVAVAVVTHDLDNAEVLGERLIRLADGKVEGEESLVPDSSTGGGGQ